MADVMSRYGSKPKSLEPDLYEKILAVAAIALFVLILTALFRGRAAWADMEFRVTQPILQSGVSGEGRTKKGGPKPAPLSFVCTAPPQGSTD